MHHESRNVTDAFAHVRQRILQARAIKMRLNLDFAELWDRGYWVLDISIVGICE